MLLIHSLCQNSKRTGIPGQENQTFKVGGNRSYMIPNISLRILIKPFISTRAIHTDGRSNRRSKINMDDPGIAASNTFSYLILFHFLFYFNG